MKTFAFCRAATPRRNGPPAFPITNYMGLQARHHAALAVLFISIFMALPAPVTSTQRGFEHSRRQVAMHADGFLEGTHHLQNATGNDGSDNAFNWDSVPDCARDLFGKYRPTPPNVHGMRELLPGIDAFYIIHDDANSKRRSRLETIMRDSRLDQLATWVNWFSEEDLRSLPPHNMGCVFNQSYAEPLFMESIRGPLSRNLKHLWVYHEMLRRNLHSVLVMEDNPVFRGGVEQMQDELSKLKGALPSEHGVVMLGDNDLAQGHPWRAAEIERSFRSSHANQKVNDHLYGPGLGHRGASGYLITATSAASILQYVYDQRKVDAEADMLMENALGSDGFFWYVPPLWVQSDSPLMVELKGPASSPSSHFSAEDDPVQSTTSMPAPPEKHHHGHLENEDIPNHDSGHPENENITNHRWSLFHQYLGTAGDDDPFRGAKWRHPDPPPTTTRYPPGALDAPPPPIP